MGHYEVLKPGGVVTSLDDDIFDSHDYIAEKKVDGVRGLLAWDEDANLLALTPKRDVTAAMPEELQHVTTMRGWILDVEFVAGSTASDVATFLAAGWRAAPGSGIVILDTLRTHEGDVRDWSLVRRRSLSGLAEGNLRGWVVPEEFAVSVPDFSIMAKAAFAQKVIDDGGEGVVLKLLYQPYSDAVNWLKFKVQRTVDCAVRSYKPGNGKFKGLAGALVLELKRNGQWVTVGTCSGMTDKVRAELTQKLDAGQSFVVEAKYQNWTNGDRLRHPRFVRVRTDKRLSDCTWESQRRQ